MKATGKLWSILLLMVLIIYGCGSSGSTVSENKNPSTPSNIVAAALNPNQINLNWSPSTDDKAVKGYYVYSGDTKVGDTSETSYNLSGLSPDTEYCYTVKAYDADGNISSTSSTACDKTSQNSGSSNDTEAPNAPTDIAATAISPNQINLTWTAPTDNTGVAGYRIYYGGTLIETPVASYSHKELLPNTEYCYFVKAIDAAGNISNASTKACATTKPLPTVDTTPPSNPANLSAKATGSGQIELSWNVSTDNVGVDGYYIYKGTDQIATVNDITYTHTGLSPNTEYCYTVKAYDAANNTSGGSNTACATTQQVQNVSTLISEAKAALANQDIDTARKKFDEAYSKNATDKDANFGSAITNLLMLIEDPDVVEIIKKWDTYSPTVKNIVYGATTNAFEVYGGKTPYCGTDPVNNGYTKLTTALTSSPYTFNGEYQYYLIYTSPFGHVKLDAVQASTGNMNNPYCTSGSTSGWNMGTVGDTNSVTLGGPSFEGSAWVIKANAGSKSVTLYTIGTPTVQKPLILSKSLSGESQEANTDIVSKFSGLMGKLPKNETSLLKKVSLALSRSIPFTAPTVSEMQTVIDNKVLSAIDGAIAKLERIEGSGYTFIVTPKMTGSAEIVNTVLDDGDFYALHSFLSLLKVSLNILTAYNLDVDWDIIEADPLSAFNGASIGFSSTLDSTKFFTLKANGLNKMATAHTAMKDVVAKAKAAYDFIDTTDTDSYTDNGLNFAGWNAQDHYAFKKWLNFSENTLNGPTDMSYDAGNDRQSFTSDDKYVSVDLSKFFTNPIDRTNLPSLSYDLPIDGNLSQSYNRPTHKYLGPGGDGIQGTEDDWTIDSETWFTSDIPDWTFNGISPNKLPVNSDSMIYLDKAVLLEPGIWWADALASDGTDIFILDGGKIFEVNPNTGKVIETFSLNLGYGVGKISWIEGMTWHNGALWATGYYYDAYGNGKNGVFQIDVVNSKPLNPIPVQSGSNIDLSGIASDGTNLYVGNNNWYSDTYYVVKFKTSALVIPTSPFITTDSYVDKLGFGGGYLWLGQGGPMEEGSIIKVDPSTGNIVKRYVRDCA